MISNKTSICHVCEVRHPLTDSKLKCQTCGITHLYPLCKSSDWFHQMICDECIHNRIQAALQWVIQQYHHLSNSKSHLIFHNIGISNKIFTCDDFSISLKTIGFDDKRGNGCIICGTPGWNNLVGQTIIHPTGVKVSRCKFCHESDLKICDRSLLPVWLCYSRTGDNIKKIWLLRQTTSCDFSDNGLLIPEIINIIMQILLSFRSQDNHVGLCTWYT